MGEQGVQDHQSSDFIARTEALHLRALSVHFISGCTLTRSERVALAPKEARFQHGRREGARARCSTGVKSRQLGTPQLRQS